VENDALPKRDNLSIMRGLVGEIVTELNATHGGSLPDTLILDVDSSGAAWIIRSELSPRLSAGGRRVLLEGRSATGPARWHVHGVRLGVTYSDIRKPGLFSEALVDREVRAEFTTEISNAGRYVGAYTNSRVSRDTVKENDIASLESGEMEFTKATVPDLKSWDRFIEPFVIIGAAGTAIFLFFQVRS